METNNKIHKIVLAIFFLLVACGVAFYMYEEVYAPGINGEKKRNMQENVEPSVNTSVDFGGGVEIKTLPIGSETEVPDLERDIVFSVATSPEVRSIIEKNATSLRADLKMDNIQYGKWLDLALQYKVAGDYEGAKEVWEYMGKIWSENSVSFQNLGDLYGYYLHDNEKAEENFLKALENGPKEIYLYFKLAEFYRDILKDTKKAQEIVKQGLVENPDNAELQALLESL